MSDHRLDEFDDGDEVEVTIRGHIKKHPGAASSYLRTTDARYTIPGFVLKDAESITLVKPSFPTVPGTVIVYRDDADNTFPTAGRTRMLTIDGRWIAPSGVDYPSAEIQLTARRLGYDIVVDLTEED